MTQLGSRGVALVYVMVVGLVSCLIAAQLVRSAFGRHLLIVKQRENIRSKTAADEAYVRAAACLVNLQWDSCATPGNNGPCPALCGAPCGEIFGDVPVSIGGAAGTVRVRVSGGPGGCTLTAAVQGS